MNARRGYWSMPPVNLGLHFNGMGAMIRSKVTPQVARKILLEAHKFTGKEAYEAGIVDAIAEPEKMYDEAVKLAAKVKGRAKMGVYGVLRNELVEEAADKFKVISYVHHKPVSRHVSIISANPF
jgi:enoyl-CoA hydratase/carnithine racemase